MRSSRMLLMGAMLVLSVWVSVPVTIGQAAAGEVMVPVIIHAAPYACIVFPEGRHLQVSIPPAASTIPSMGLVFLVKGNAKAEVTAIPERFLFVSPENRYFGKAVQGDHQLGYNLIVEFPRFDGWHALTGRAGEGTRPYQVDMRNGVVEGMLHLLADHHWTADGSWPAPGIYTGVVTVMVSAME